MYLGLVLIVLAVLFLIAGIASGGVFTLVLVPLAVIATVAALTMLVSARAAGMEATLTRTRPLRWGSRSPAAGPDSVAAGSSPPRESAGATPAAGAAADDDVPVTPDEYLEARQKSQ